MRQTTQFTVGLLRRITEFLQRTQPSILIGELKSHIAQLSTITDEMSTLQIEQETRRRQSQAGTATLRKQLRTAKFEFMRPVSRMARVLFPDDPETRRAMSVPHRLFRPEEVVAALHAMAVSAEPHKAEFIAGGFATDFIERMHFAADALKAAVDARSREFGRRAAASGGAFRLAQRGRALVRLIDAMVAPRLQGNPELISEWRSLLRQGRMREAPIGEPTDPSTDGPGDPTRPTTPTSPPPTPTTPLGEPSESVVTPIVPPTPEKADAVPPAIAA